MNIVLFLQSLGSWLASPMRFFSFLGSTTFYLVVTPALYWCIDAVVGLRFGLYLSFSASFYEIIKILLHSPRPYWVDRRVTAYAPESSFGIPSGHSQNAVMVWGGLAASIRKSWAWVLAVILAILIGISRVYLGVHFPGDVLAGWMIGLVLLGLLLRSEKPLLDWLRRLSFNRQILAVLIASLGMILIAGIVRLALDGWQVPQEWIENAAAAYPGADPIDPLSISSIVSNAAIFFGLSAGALWLSKRGGFQTRGAWWQLLLRYLIGLIGVLLFWYGLDRIFPESTNLLGYSLRYVRYALVGGWVSGFGPAVFIKLRLAHPKNP